MKYLVFCLVLCAFQLPLHAEQVCEASPESKEFVDPLYKSENEPWKRNLQNPDFAAWNKKFDNELQASVQAISKDKIETKQPLQNKFTISMSGRNQKVLKIYRVKPSSSHEFDELCEKAINELDGAPILKYPGENHNFSIFKPISFSMPANQFNDSAAK